MSQSNGISNLQSLLSAVNLSAAKPVSAAKPEERAPSGARSASAATDGDQTVLSSTSALLARALSGSDVRTEKVAALKLAIDSGSYQVPASEVAGKLIQSLLK